MIEATRRERSEPTDLNLLDQNALTARLPEKHRNLAPFPANGSHRARRSPFRQTRESGPLGIHHDLVGRSSQMLSVYRDIAKVAPTNCTIMIRGESGTGKELVARALHSNSPRAARPFVPINCAALTETLLESELFGHERGSFTGAIEQTKGKFEAANGGTVFLDEIAELAPSLQVKLLRATQESEIERVGSTRSIKVDIRLIAATNGDLEMAIKRGNFRHDLYYRLNVISLWMPPLRERPGDIPLLASHFAKSCGKKYRKRVIGVSPEACSLLCNYEWPGNVRELENTIERAVVLGASALIVPSDLPSYVLDPQNRSANSNASYHDGLKQTKKKLIVGAVESARGNYTEAARRLKVHPNYLHRLIRELDLKPMITECLNLLEG